MGNNNRRGDMPALVILFHGWAVCNNAELLRCTLNGATFPGFDFIRDAVRYAHRPITHAEAIAQASWLELVDGSLSNEQWAAQSNEMVGHLDKRYYP